MSALGDRLRTRKSTVSVRDYGARSAYDDAAHLADEHEAAALAESAQGRGPHAAAALRWAAGQIEQGHFPDACVIGVSGLRRWSRQAEQ